MQKNTLIKIRYSVLILIALAGLATLFPLWLPVAFAAWLAQLCQPLQRRINRWWGGRRWLTTSVVTIGLGLLLVPILLLCIYEAFSAFVFVKKLFSSPQSSVLTQLFSDQSNISIPSLKPFHWGKWLAFLGQYKAAIFDTVQKIAGTGSSVFISGLTFFLSFYVFSLHLDTLPEKIQKLPLEFRDAAERLVAAFFETGRGMIIAVGLTAVVQGALATILYFSLSIPNALLLGFLTVLAAFLPSIGTGLVWMPVMVALLIQKRFVAAGILGAGGIVLVGLIDNLTLPYFSKYGKLQLSTLTLFISVFSGIALFGLQGIILGPLLVRLGKECMLILFKDIESSN